MYQYQKMLNVLIAAGGRADKDTLIMGISDPDTTNNCHIHRHGPAYRLSTYFYDARKHGYQFKTERVDGKLYYSLVTPAAKTPLQIADQRPKVMILTPETATEFLAEDAKRAA